eukprot:SAG11_NODE_31526_length_291_cov_0.807292_1_plen_31_part_10
MRNCHVQLPCHAGAESGLPIGLNVVGPEYAD